MGYHRAGLSIRNETVCEPAEASVVSEATCWPSSEMSKRTWSAPAPSMAAVTLALARFSDLSTTVSALRSARRAP